MKLFLTWVTCSDLVKDLSIFISEAYFDQWSRSVLVFLEEGIMWTFV